MGILCWQDDSFARSLLHLPVEDWTSERMWALLIFFALFWFNEPLWLIMIWAPDQQISLRSFHAATATGAVATYLGFIAFSIYRIKYADKRPPSLVVWLEHQDDNDEATIANGTGADENRLHKTISRISTFSMAIKSEFKDDSSQISVKNTTISEHSGSNPVTISAVGMKTFCFHAGKKAFASVMHIQQNPSATMTWQHLWGPSCIAILTILLWVYPQQLYREQLNNGPVNRPRLTFVYAMDQHPGLMIKILITVAAYFTFVLGSILHAVSDLCLATQPYLVFYGITLLTALLLILGTMNSSFYPTGTPLLETVFSRTTLNAYAWVIVIMIKPLSSTDGQFSKRAGVDSIGPDREYSDSDVSSGSTSDDETDSDSDNKNTNKNEGDNRRIIVSNVTDDERNDNDNDSRSSTEGSEHYSYVTEDEDVDDDESESDPGEYLNL